MTMASTTYIDQQGKPIDLALGTANGSIIFLDSNNLFENSTLYVIFSSPIPWIQWSSMGIFAATSSAVRLIDYYDLTTKLIIIPTQEIFNAAFGVNFYTNDPMVALSYSNKI
jgi:WD40 repeat protein